MEVNTTEVPMEEIELRLKRLDIRFGGHWKPKDCKPRWKVCVLWFRRSKKGHQDICMTSFVFFSQVAILIPFRNRHEHLPILFQHLAPMLQRQRLQFAFYVIEQV